MSKISLAKKKKNLQSLYEADVYVVLPGGSWFYTIQSGMLQLFPLRRN